MPTTEVVIRAFEQFALAEKEYKARKEEIDRIKHQLAKEMMDKGVMKMIIGNVDVTLVQPSTRKVVDTEKLKQAGIYDDYTYESETNAYVKLKEYVPRAKVEEVNLDDLVHLLDERKD